ncbi:MULTISPECIES: tripartite tricarboxylate transporter substrate binding protein [unclassified Achromobacter]|uniref:Bug family tripartite tricarboxylate transporter substrate binding protein n=1 Tax=unclassified Achromobacter TaxID=2626865 RepID=UPI000B519524|nr:MULTISPECIES: tripartite tricarboxylate transporter substrate binding protein [unclassified Achromobacter]OWT72824.1 LacI family transcriptional regulator [Achromobacter sp. HZ34]OWT74043.1 LacI family transcriptional regulator [Achromobacter sp. HZ28]
MDHQRRVLLAGMAAAAAGFTLPTLARAESKYPSGPITMIVPFPPGGGTDAASRLIAQFMGQATGWNIVVENRAGAGGNIGLGLLSRAKADGLTIGMGQTSNLAINPSLYPKMPYDSLKDFVPIVLVAGQPVVLVVSAASKYKSLDDVVKAAKAKPEAITMASAGIGTVGHLAGAMFMQAAGVKFLHVPHPGASTAVTNMIGGQVDIYFATPATVLPLISTGKLRALAVTSKDRLAALPDVPSIAQQGYADFDARDWKGLVAPTGTPAEAVQRINSVVNDALKKPLTIERFAAEGSTPIGGTPEDFATFLKSEYKRWGDTVRASGAKME